MPTPIKVKDLKAYTGTKNPRPFLKCFECSGEYSAESGDYFMLAPETPLMCCETPMRRVFKTTHYEDAK
jgi:hypothetical protein